MDQDQIAQNRLQTTAIVKLEKIYYSSSDMIKTDSYGAVFEGYYEVKTVKAAVKCIMASHQEEYNNEVKHLRLFINDKIVVRYLASQRVTGNSGYFIATELAKCTLEQYIKKKSDVNCNTVVWVLKKVSKGLEYVHARNIVHCDIKPSSILIADPRRPGGRNRVLLAEFGKSKNLSECNYSTTTGTLDWMSPERLIAYNNGSKFPVSKESDVYSLGLTFFFALTGGKHPCGSESSYWQANIMKEEFVFDPSSLDVVYLTLITAMLDKEPKNRPNMGAILKHPFFWDPERNLKFIQKVSNYLCSAPNDKKEINSHSEYLCNSNWQQELCQHVKDYINPPEAQSKKEIKIQNSKRYDSKSALKLIEFIRDKEQHSTEWTSPLKQDNVFGKDDATFAKYFTSRFPRLIPFLYGLLHKSSNMRLKEFYTDYPCPFLDLMPYIQCPLKILNSRPRN